MRIEQGHSATGLAKGLPMLDQPAASNVHQTYLQYENMNSVVEIFLKLIGFRIIVGTQAKKKAHLQQQ
jgi:hypothetical protein